jgi:anti-sigma B factor antagonist
MDLRIEEEHSAGTWTVAVEGDVDLKSAPQLCSCLTAHRGQRVIVDLSGVGFCDSCGLRALTGEARETHIAGGNIAVVAPEGSAVRRLLELCGLTELLAVHADRGRALAAA